MGRTGDKLNAEVGEMRNPIVLDTETTGFDPESDRVIELSVVDYVTGETLFDHRFNPERFIPQKIVELTGITNESVSLQPRFDQVAREVHGLIVSAEAVIGYNVAFDRRFIDAEMKRAVPGNCPLTWPILVDPLRVWDVCEPREKRDLTNAYKRFVDSMGFEGAHGALADVTATRRVLYAQLAEFNLKDVPWDQLDPERKSWWGPSNHILSVDEVLIMNFGKHSSRPVDEVDVGFWRWLTKKDFPDHVVMLGIKMIEFCVLHSGDRLRRTVSEWGASHRNKI